MLKFYEVHHFLFMDFLVKECMSLCSNVVYYTHAHNLTCKHRKKKSL